MPIQAILIPEASGTPNISITLNESADPHLELTLKKDGTTGSYNAYHPHPPPTTGAQTEIREIQVIYTGASVENFRLRGITIDGSKPEIDRIQHLASASMTTRIEWSYPAQDTIRWVFEDPAALNTWVSWEFNHSGTTPPVRVKVVLKRQS